MTMSRRVDNHINYDAATIIEQYSVSVLDCETIGCFFAFQNTQLDPINMQQPGVDILVLGQPAQLSSKNSYRCIVLWDNI